MNVDFWNLNFSDQSLEFLSEEYNRLEAFSEGLGERFFDSSEGLFFRIKNHPFEFPLKTAIYRRGLINLTRKLQYAIYFRLENESIFIDVILSTSIDPDKHPSD